jgi:hypothetical protein
MQFEAQLVHAEAGKRVVQVRALANDQCLGSALGEAPTAEEAEDRASHRLIARLGIQPEQTRQIRDTTNGSDPLSTSTPAPIRSQAPVTAPPSEPATAPSAAPDPAPAAIKDAEPKLPPFQKLDPPSEELGDEPEDWSSELARLDLQLQRLGWTRAEEAIYLERAFNHPSRNRLTSYVDLVAYLKALEVLSPGANPCNAPVPLRRKDLLSQCDQLLGQLQWDASRGRSYLEQHFNLSSRQQLNDTQLLQFNMLLEGELMGA